MQTDIYGRNVPKFYDSEQQTTITCIRCYNYSVIDNVCNFRNEFISHKDSLVSFCFRWIPEFKRDVNVIQDNK